MRNYQNYSELAKSVVYFTVLARAEPKANDKFFGVVFRSRMDSTLYRPKKVLVLISQLFENRYEA